MVGAMSSCHLENKNMCYQLNLDFRGITNTVFSISNPVQYLGRIKDVSLLNLKFKGKWLPCILSDNLGHETVISMTAGHFL